MASQARQQSASGNNNANKKNIVEVFGERVFVTSPRMFSFSHRCPTSIRHPFVPVALATLASEAEHARGGKKATTATSSSTRAERMAEYFNDNDDEERWKAVGRMLDSMLFEPDICNRRQHALDNAFLRRTLEMAWCKAGGTPSKGISEESYKQMHTALYRELLQVSDVAMHGIITKSISQDWQWDSDGRGEVEFGRYCLSLLELADNWVANCEGENYGKFLEGLVQRVFTSPSQATPSSPALLHSATTTIAASPSLACSPDRALQMSVDAADQQAKVAFIARNAQLYKTDKLVTRHWSARHTTVYKAIPLASIGRKGS